MSAGQGYAGFWYLIERPLEGNKGVCRKGRLPSKRVSGLEG